MTDITKQIEQALNEAYPVAASSLGEVEDRAIEMRGFRKGFAAALHAQAAATPSPVPAEPRIIRDDKGELVAIARKACAPAGPDTAELPPLPEGKALVKSSEWEDARSKRQSFNGWRINYGDCDMHLYTADQMRDYARAAIASRPAPVAAMTVEQARRTGYGEGVRRAAQLVEQAIDNEGRMALAARIRDLQSAAPAAPSTAQAAGVEELDNLKRLRRYVKSSAAEIGDSVHGHLATLDRLIEAAERQPQPAQWDADHREVTGLVIATPSEGVAAPVEPAVVEAGEMTAERAAFFMRRFKGEEKLLGPNEQKAVAYVLALLESQAAAAPAQPSADQVRDAALEEAAKEAEHWQRINTSHKCGEYIAAAIRALRTTASGEKGGA